MGNNAAMALKQCEYARGPCAVRSLEEGTSLILGRTYTIAQALQRSRLHDRIRRHRQRCCAAKSTIVRRLFLREHLSGWLGQFGDGRVWRFRNPFKLTPMSPAGSSRAERAWDGSTANTGCTALGMLLQKPMPCLPRASTSKPRWPALSSIMISTSRCSRLKASSGRNRPWLEQHVIAHLLGILSIVLVQRRCRATNLGCPILGRLNRVDA